MTKLPPNPPWIDHFRNISILGVAGLLAVVLGGVGWGYYALTESFRDYDQVAACLVRHGFTVEDGWQQTDVVLEDFGLIFQLVDGRMAEIQILDGRPVRDCGDRVAGLFISSAEKPYLPLSNPRLVSALGGQEIRTMEDMLAQLEVVLAWAEKNPDALRRRVPVSAPERYVTLMIPPM